jgi:nucleotide-binding universal stress UspA family protein
VLHVAAILPRTRSREEIFRAAVSIAETRRARLTLIVAPHGLGLSPFHEWVARLAAPLTRTREDIAEVAELANAAPRAISVRTIGTTRGTARPIIALARCDPVQIIVVPRSWRRLRRAFLGAVAAALVVGPDEAVSASGKR